MNRNKGKGKEEERRGKKIRKDQQHEIINWKIRIKMNRNKGKGREEERRGIKRRRRKDECKMNREELNKKDNRLE